MCRKFATAAAFSWHLPHQRNVAAVDRLGSAPLRVSRRISHAPVLPPSRCAENDRCVVAPTLEFQKPMRGRLIPPQRREPSSVAISWHRGWLPEFRRPARIGPINVDRDKITVGCPTSEVTLRGTRDVSGEDGSSGCRPRDVSRRIRLDVSVKKAWEQTRRARDPSNSQPALNTAPASAGLSLYRSGNRMRSPRRSAINRLKLLENPIVHS
jgi:hypothetical protein